MKVLFIASDNNYTSGAFLSMIKLNQLLRSEYDIYTYVILPNEGDGVELLENEGIPFEIVNSRNWVVDIEEGMTEEREKKKEKELKSNTKAINRIIEIIQEKKIDIVHINTTYSYVGAVAAKKTRTPYIWHLREFLEEDQHRKIWDKEKGYQLIGEADAIIAISNSIYNKYQEFFSDKLHTIYNGIDEKQFWNPNKIVFENEIISFGMTGGIVPHKGQEELIRACGILKNRNIQNFRVHFYGKGKEEYKEYLLKIVKECNIEDNVFFEGPTSNVSEALKFIDVLFVCSKNEAFGRTTVEGMMSGCVVVGADTAGTTELLENGKSGFMYKQGSSESLANVIEKILKDKSTANAIRNIGQEVALYKYNAHKNAEEIHELYKSVLVNREKKNG